MLSAIGIRVQRGARTVLQETTLDWPTHQICALIGPNGAGKSTLIRTLSGGQAESLGEVRVAGESLKGITGHRRARTISYLPQSTEISFGYTVAELLNMSAATPQALQSAIAAGEVEGLLPSSLLNLSGGERQRALLARTLAQDTPILLLDEPFAALDPRHTLRIGDALRAAANRGALVLFAVHDLRLAQRLAQRLILMHQGRVFADGPPHEVLTSENIGAVYGVSREHLTLA